MMHWFERQYQNIKYSFHRQHPLCTCQKQNFELRAETVNYMNMMESRIIALEKMVADLQSKTKS